MPRIESTVGLGHGRRHEIVVATWAQRPLTDSDPRTHPADGELTEVGWYGLDELQDVDVERRRRIAFAAEDGPTRFEGGL